LGRVVWIDGFGNALTDIVPEAVGGRALILDGRVIDGPRLTYGDAAPDVPFWYVGSGGTVEFALRDGHGARTFSWHVGLAVRLSAP
jgi:S-adenosyl-L-methionine hydrolase (adenosine-forming)